MRINSFAIFCSLLLIGLVSFASYGGGGGGGTPSVSKDNADLFLTGACSNQPVSVSVSVNGAPLKGAFVEITKLNRGSSPSSLTSGSTDSSGVFTFTPVQPSDYDAVVTANSINSVGKIFTVNDCTQKPVIETPNNESGINFQCADLSSMKERIACRINLPEEQAQNNLLFLPEECRVLNGIDRDNCIATYTVIQKCRHLTTDKDRDACFFNQVSDLHNVKSLRVACAGNSSCVDNLRNQVFGYVKFRIYNLEEKAEKLWGRGFLTQNETVDFIDKLESKKQLFNTAVSVDDKKAIVMQMQQDWETLRATVLSRGGSG